jgi:hypothetical protein
MKDDFVKMRTKLQMMTQELAKKDKDIEVLTVKLQ